MKRLIAALLIGLIGCVPTSGQQGQSAEEHVSVRSITGARYNHIILTIDSVNNVYCYTMFQQAISCVDKSKK